jgi:hypothetical protein
MPPVGASASSRAGNVHAVTVEIISIDDQVADVQTDAEHDLFGFRTFPVRVAHGLLEFNRR